MSEPESSPTTNGAVTVYDDLRRQIISGTYEPGSRLVEARLAVTYKMSRTPIRAALARLEGDGLIETIPNRGAFVARWSNADIDEVYALRVRLEPYGTYLATQRIEKDALDALDVLAAQMIDALADRQDGWAERCSALNSAFHDALLQASGSPRLISFLTSLTELPLVQRSITVHEPDALRRNFDQHLQILQAMRQGDAEWAEAIMRAHLMGARDTLRHRSTLQNLSPRGAGDLA